MILAEKRTHRPVEQNRESRSKPIFIWANNFQQKKPKAYRGESKASSVNGAGKTGKPPAKE